MRGGGFIQWLRSLTTCMSSSVYSVSIVTVPFSLIGDIYPSTSKKSLHFVGTASKNPTQNHRNQANCMYRQEKEKKVNEKVLLLHLLWAERG